MPPFCVLTDAEHQQQRLHDIQAAHRLNASRTYVQNIRLQVQGVPGLLPGRSPNHSSMAHRSQPTDGHTVSGHPFTLDIRGGDIGQTVGFDNQQQAYPATLPASTGQLWPLTQPADPRALSAAHQGHLQNLMMYPGPSMVLGDGHGTQPSLRHPTATFSADWRPPSLTQVTQFVPSDYGNPLPHLHPNAPDVLDINSLPRAPASSTADFAVGLVSDPLGPKITEMGNSAQADPTEFAVRLE